MVGILFGANSRACVASRAEGVEPPSQHETKETKPVIGWVPLDRAGMGVECFSQDIDFEETRSKAEVANHGRLYCGDLQFLQYAAMGHIMAQGKSSNRWVRNK